MMKRRTLLVLIVMGTAALGACAPAERRPDDASPPDSAETGVALAVAQPDSSAGPAAGSEVNSMPTIAASHASYPDLGAAPEFHNEIWINTDQPISLAGLGGRVVLLEFWTFGCVNCQRTLPYIDDWHERYSGERFQVVGIHYPEFAYERDFDNVVEATERFGIAYPVAMDNNGRTWRAYNQRYWPTSYLIDANGRIRYKHIGEFREPSAAEFEAAIQALLAEAKETELQ